jgi:hypothetical protein
VRDGIAIEQKVTLLKVIKKGKHGNQNSDCGHAGRAAVGNGVCLFRHFALAAGFVMD